MEYTFYKIQVGNECYVGSSKDLKKRLQKHKSNCHNEKNRGYNIKVYKSIREVGWDNIDIMIIDEIIYNSRNEAFDMETKYMLMFDAKLNSCYPKRTKEEYYEANKEKISERDRKYRESKLEMIREKSKKYYDENRDKALNQKKNIIKQIKKKNLKKGNNIMKQIKKKYWKALKNIVKPIKKKCLKRVENIMKHIKKKYRKALGNIVNPIKTNY